MKSAWIALWLPRSVSLSWSGNYLRNGAPESLVSGFAEPPLLPQSRASTPGKATKTSIAAGVRFSRLANSARAASWSLSPTDLSHHDEMIGKDVPASRPTRRAIGSILRPAWATHWPGRFHIRHAVLDTPAPRGDHAAIVEVEDRPLCKMRLRRLRVRQAKFGSVNDDVVPAEPFEFSVPLLLKLSDSSKIRPRLRPSLRARSLPFATAARRVHP
jgi:hypothetical protein